MDSARLTAVLREWGIGESLAGLLVSRIGRFYAQVLQADPSTELEIRFRGTPPAMGPPGLILSLDLPAERRGAVEKWFAEYFGDRAVQSDLQIELAFGGRWIEHHGRIDASTVLAPSSFHGKILTVNASGFGTIEGTEDHGQHFFSFDRISGYGGQSARELGLRPGAQVEVISTSTGELASVKIVPA